MSILALDPSSTATGYAVLRDDGSLADAGLLKPDRTRDDANTRIAAMHRALIEVLKEHTPAHVVVEDTSGKVGHRGRARGMNGAGMAIHGKAVGYFICAVKAAGYVPECVLENVWTRQVPKAVRQSRVAVAFPAYAGVSDPGGDVADAIGLADWWRTNQQPARVPVKEAGK